MSNVLPSPHEVQKINWEGSIPTLITLAPSSLSTPTAPPPIHILLSRQTFLHLGLETAVRRLHPFAPPSFSFGNKRVQEEPEPGDKHEENTTPQSTEKQDFPVCWFEDDDTKMPLRWHLWAGVLYDLQGRRPDQLPWRLRIHFNSYPSGTILPLEAGQVERQVRAVFQNSLKQAVTLRTSQARSSLQLLGKGSHDTLWQAISSQLNDTLTSARLYRQVATELLPKLDTQETSARIPVRVLVSNGRPAIQKSCLLSNEKTLEKLFQEWLPDLCFPVTTTDGTEETNSKKAVAGWKINGIQPPLHIPLVELWENLCHADFFLYIIILLESS